MPYLFADELAAFAELKDWDPDQHPRDEHGRFASNGGGRLFDPPTPVAANAGGIAIGGDNVGSEVPVRGFGAVSQEQWSAREAGEKLIQAPLRDLDDEPVPLIDQPHVLKQMAAAGVAARMKDVPYEEIVRVYPGFDRAVMDAEKYPGTPYADDKGFRRMGDGSIEFAGRSLFDPKPDGSPGEWSVTGNIGTDQELLDQRAHKFGEFIPFGDPRSEALGREYVASNLIASWAGTSNDSDEQSLAIQEVAARTFGIDSYQQWDLETADPPGAANTRLRIADEVERNGDVYERFLRAQYDETQERFREAGIDSMQLYRGFAFPGGNAPEWVGEAEDRAPGDHYERVPLRPLSSFSAGWDAASVFANGSTAQDWDYTGGTSVLVGGRVPVERILSFAGAGQGSMEEHEFVVIGGPAVFATHIEYVDPVALPEDSEDPDNIGYTMAGAPLYGSDEQYPAVAMTGGPYT